MANNEALGGPFPPAAGARRQLLGPLLRWKSSSSDGVSGVKRFLVEMLAGLAFIIPRYLVSICG